MPLHPRPPARPPRRFLTPAGLALALSLAAFAVARAGASGEAPAPPEDPATEPAPPASSPSAGAPFAQGATDLATAARLAGGGAGGATPVAPSLWGLEDFGGYLVVVDGVPWGGAFTPAISRVDIADVETIEVESGAAPVLYGTGSVSGVVRVTRYAPGLTPGVAHASLGSYGSGGAGVAGALPALGTLSHAASVDVEREGLRGVDERLTDVHGLYRASTPLAGGVLDVEAELESETRLPESPVSRVGTSLASTPLDANYQPADARIGGHRVQGLADYRRATPLGALEAEVAYALGTVADRRGFLRAPPLDQGPANADGFNQQRTLRSVYADVHLDSRLSPSLTLGWGGDWLGGAATQTSQDFAYYAPLAATARAPSSSSVPVTATSGFSDQRSFAGAYLEVDWTPTRRASVSLTTRLSRNEEARTSTASADFVGPLPVSAAETRTDVSLGAGLALGYQFGGEPGAATGGVRARLAYRSTRQPPTPDFGPEYTPSLLKPMQGNRLEGGVKGGACDGRCDFDLAASYADIGNLVVAQTDANGNPVLANAGNAHVRTVDLDTRLRRATGSALVASLGAGWHRATFGATRTIEEGVPTDLVGHDLALTPRFVASAGLAYQPERGAYAALGVSYAGRRFLDRLNQAPVGGFATVDLRAGWRTARGGVALKLANLGNRRDVVAESEFGDQAYYRTPARSVALEAYLTWR